MKNLLTLLIILFLPYTIQQSSIEFNFPRTIYMIPKIENKLVNVTSSIPNNEIKLFYTHQTEDFTNYCSSDSDNSKMFNCVFSKYGTYKFTYEYQNENKTLDNIVQIFSSLNDIFTITKTRDTSCLYKKEPFQYTLNPKNGVIVDFNNIQVYAYSKINPIINITEETKIILKNDSNVYTIDQELNLTKFDIVVTEIEDIKDSLGTFENISVTDIKVDNYFFPSLYKIRFEVTQCDFKPDKLILNDDLEINCNESSKFFENTNSIICTFENKITSFGKKKISFNNVVLKNDIFVSNSINKTRFYVEKTGNGPFNFTITCPDQDFCFESISRIDYNLWDNLGVYSYNNINYFNNNSYKLNEYSLTYYIPLTQGFNHSAIRIVRKLYENEIELNAKEYNYYFNAQQSLIYNVVLTPVIFDPDFVITGNLLERYSHRTTILKVPKYAYQFCSNNYSRYEPQATRTFYCKKYTVSDISATIEDPSSFPELIMTQIRGHIGPGVLKVLRLDFYNYCQDIFGEVKNKENSLLDFYIPIGDNITVKYNQKDYAKNKNVNIKKNPFDYTFYNFIIPANQIVQGGIVEITYNGNIIQNIEITYSNVLLPSLIQRIQRINRDNNPSQIIIRFSEPINIGANEIRNSFYLGYYKKDLCTLQSNNLTLICSNNYHSYKELYYEGKCETNVMDYHVEYYSLPKNDFYLNRKYYVLPGNKKLITFYYKITSENSNFPMKVFVNEEEVTKWQTSYGARTYYYSTNKVGDYQFSLLSKDKVITLINEIVYVRESFSDFFPKFEGRKCAYYTHNITYSFAKTNIVDLNYILCDTINYYSHLSGNSFTFDSHSYYNGTIYYRTGRYSLTIKSENDKSYPYLFKDIVTFTNVLTSRITYSFDMILINSLCLLENLSVERYGTSQKIPLTCDLSLYRYGQYYCQPSETLKYGLYRIYYNNIITDYTFISVPIENADLSININETKVGINYIIIRSDNFVLDSVYKVILKDNDAVIRVFYEYYPKHKYDNVFRAFTSTNDNYLSFNFVAHPGKSYNIQLYNGRGFSKILQLGRKIENIEFSLDKKYYVINVNPEIIPSIIVQGDYASDIEYIYYRNERNREKFDFKRRMTGKEIDNKKVFKFAVTKKGTYYFSYSLYNDTIKFEILDRRIIVGETIMDMILFFPPANTILNSKDYSIDIIPIYTLSLNVFISKDDLVPLVSFTRKKGVSNYDIKVTDIEKIAEGNYKFVIQEATTKELFYKQDINIANFKFEEAYYVSLRFFKIYNVNYTISDLWIYNDVQEFLLKESNQTLDKQNNILKLTFPNKITSGYYYVDLDDAEIASIFLSKDLNESDFLIYPISGKNNVVIKSSNYYLQFITNITLLDNNTNEIYRINHSEIIFKNNAYLKFSIPDVDKNHTLILLNLTEKCPYSPSDDCSKIMNYTLIYDEPIPFTYEENYQITTNKKQKITFNFNEIISKQKMNSFISKLYFNGELKILDSDPDKESCIFSNKSITCEFIYPGEFTELSINYNEFESTSQKYIYIYYFFDGESCMIEGESLNSYQLDLGNNNYSVYHNNKKLIKNQTTGNYTIDLNINNYGLNNIYLELNSKKILLNSFNYYPNFELNIEGEITAEKNGINIGLLSKLKNIDIVKKINVSLRLPTSDEKIIITLQCSIKNSKTICTADLSSIGEGIYFIQYDNVCGRTIDLDKIKLYNKNAQKLMKIYPNFVSVTDNKDIPITLTYKNKFTEKTRPIKIAIVDKKAKKFIDNSIFDKISYNENTASFNLPSYLINKENIGEYKIKTIFGDENSEIVSINTIVIGNRLSLYEKKQRLIQSEKMTTIGIIFNSEISLSQISKVTYNDIELDYDIHDPENYTNILIVNITTSGIDFNKTGNHSFKIYENGFEEPLTYKIEIVGKRNGKDNVIINHYAYKNTEDKKAYVVVSVSDDIYYIGYTVNEDSNTVPFGLKALWSNSFVAKINIIEGSLTFYYNDDVKDEIKKLDNNTVYVFSNITTFIGSSFDDCQYNYCPFKNINDDENCFTFFQFQYHRLDLNAKTDLYYGLYSLSTKQTTRISSVHKPWPTISHKLTNNIYQLQVIRKDIVDDEPIVLFETNITLSNLKLNHLTYDNNLITANMTTLCHIKEYFYMYGTKFQNCKYTEEDYNLVCEFSIRNKVAPTYYLNYHGEIIGKVSTLSGFVYYITTSTSRNGKGRFTIHTVNEKFGALNITKVTVTDYYNKNNIVNFSGDDIIYQSNFSAYVEVGANQLSKKVYLSNITLFDGNIYNVTGSDIKTFVFDKITSVSPNYLFSYEDYDKISVQLTSTLYNMFLIHDNIENEISCSSRAKGFTCLASDIEYGLDYLINYYNNVILHTIKTSFDRKCHSSSMSNNITFTLQSEENITNIKTKFKVKLLAQSNNKEMTNRITYLNNRTENNIYFYDYTIKVNGLSEGYYIIQINDNKLTGGNILVAKGKTLKKRIGDLYSSIKAQYLIVEFNEELFKDEVLRIFIQKDEKKINGYCENLLDNTKAVICKFTNSSDSIIEDGNYELGYYDKCSNAIMLKNNLTIKSSNSISYPYETSIKHIFGSSSKPEISFNKIINNISSISLIATSNNLNETIVSNTNNGAVTSINIPTNQKLGNYLIKITYSDNFVVIIPLVSIYDDKFDILNYKPAVTINSFSTKNFAIEFTGNYNHNQITNVYLVYDQYYGNEQVQEINSFTFNNKKLIILDDIKVIDIEQLHFEIKGDIKTYDYYFHVINVNRYIYFDYPYLLNLNKNNLYIDFYQYNGEFTYLRDVVGKISTINDINFKFYYCYRNKCRLGRTNFNLNIGNPSTSQLIFYNKKGGKLGISTTQLDIIPNKFIESYIPFKNKGEYHTFKTDGDYEYTSIFPFYNNPNNGYYYRLLDIQTYKVIFPYTENHHYYYFSHRNTISYKYNLYKYTLINHSILIRNPIDNTKFITANLNPYICNAKGHIYYILDGQVSCKACSKLYPNAPYKKDNYCVSSCYYQFKPHMQCYNSCNKNEIGTTKNVYYENNKCVLECSDGFGRDFASSNNCYNCTINKKFVSGGFCKTCDEINEEWCRAPKYFDKDIRVGSCDQYNCYNGGICYIKNFEAYCTCPKDYYGLRCELTLEQASSQAKNLVSDFLSPKEGGRIVEGDDGELIFDLDDEKNIKQIREISNLMKEPSIALNVGRKTMKKLFHSVGTMIMKMMDGVIDLNSNVLELFDLASNLVSSNLQIRGLARLRLLDDDDDEINEEEEIKKLEDLLQQARKIYKLITFEDIKNGIFNKTSGSADYKKSRSIYYQRWYNTEESNSQLSDSIRGNDELMTIDFSSCSSKDNQIIFISVSLSSKLREVLEKYENKEYKITNAYTDGYDVTNGVDSATKYDLTQCKNLTAYLPINQDIIDVEKYKLYSKANINIYNPKDKAFCESCFITNGLDYDLTQKYRKLQVFDNKTIESDDCVYDSIDIDLIKLKMYCVYKESFNYLYKVVETHLDNNKTIKIDNLPLKCASYVEKLEQNIGLWVYLILTILVFGGLFYCIKNYYDIYIQKNDQKITIERKSTDKIPINKENCEKLDVNEKQYNLKIYKNYTDKDFENNNGIKEEKNETINHIQINKNKVENNIIENKEIEENKKIEGDNEIEEYSQSINESSESSKNNESNENNKNEHPFDNFFIEEEKKETKEIPKEEEPKEELIEGYILEEENKEPFKKILIRNILEHYPLVTFFNNTLFNPLLFNICVFAFNIVLIFGSNSLFYFESIIEKRISNKNRNQFIYPLSKEILKIIISIIFSMIGMLIIRAIMIIPRIKNKKLKQYLDSGNEIKENKVLQVFFIRRIVSCIIMFIFSVFLFYYTIVFCSLYKNTQINWIIGGIWSLLIEWVILAPLYIFIISIVEKRGRSQKVSSYYMKKLFLF